MHTELHRCRAEDVIYGVGKLLENDAWDCFAYVKLYMHHSTTKLYKIKRRQYIRNCTTWLDAHDTTLWYVERKLS